MRVTGWVYQRVAGGILARLCVKAGRLKKSVETYRKILERRPSDAGEIEQEIDRLEERMEDRSS